MKWLESDFGGGLISNLRKLHLCPVFEDNRFSKVLLLSHGVHEDRSNAVSKNQGWMQFST